MKNKVVLGKMIAVFAGFFFFGHFIFSLNFLGVVILLRILSVKQFT